MKKLIGIAFSLGMMGLITGCAAISTNHVITGVVADVESNPVAGAMITTAPPTSSVFTDKDGRYMIKAVKEGEYTLRADKMGYVAIPSKIAVRGIDFIQGDIRLVPEDMIPVAAPVYVEPEPAQEAPESANPAASSAVEKVSEAAEAGTEKAKAWWEK